MKSIMMTYPGYQALPRGLKRLLVASETFFFAETGAQTLTPDRGLVQSGGSLSALHDDDASSQYFALNPAWQN